MALCPILHHQEALSYHHKGPHSSKMHMVKLSSHMQIPPIASLFIDFICGVSEHKISIWLECM